MDSLVREGISLDSFTTGGPAFSGHWNAAGRLWLYRRTVFRTRYRRMAAVHRHLFSLGTTGKHQNGTRLADHIYPDNRDFGLSHIAEQPAADRKSVVSGQSVSVRVDLGGRRVLKKKQT